MSLFSVDPSKDLVASFAGTQFCVKHFYTGFSLVPQHQLLLLVLDATQGWLANRIIEDSIDPAELAGGAKAYILNKLPAINAVLQSYFGPASAPAPVTPGAPAPSVDPFSLLDSEFLATFTYTTLAGYPVMVEIPGK